MQLGADVGVVGAGALELELGIEEFLLELGVDEVHEERVGLDFRAGEHANAEHCSFGLGGDEADTIFAGNEGSGAAHLAEQRALSASLRFIAGRKSIRWTHCEPNVALASGVCGALLFATGQEMLMRATDIATTDSRAAAFVLPCEAAVVPSLTRPGLFGD